MVYINLKQLLDWLVQQYGNGRGVIAHTVFAVIEHLQEMEHVYIGESEKRKDEIISLLFARVSEFEGDRLGEAMRADGITKEEAALYGVSWPQRQAPLLPRWHLSR